MKAVLWTLAALLGLAGIMLVRRPRRPRLRDRADGERLGVRISNAIEQIRRGR